MTGWEKLLNPVRSTSISETGLVQFLFPQLKSWPKEFLKKQCTPASEEIGSKSAGGSTGTSAEIFLNELLGATIGECFNQISINAFNTSFDTNPTAMLAVYDENFNFIVGSAPKKIVDGFNVFVVPETEIPTTKIYLAYRSNSDNSNYFCNSGAEGGKRFAKDIGSYTIQWPLSISNPIELIQPRNMRITHT